MRRDDIITAIFWAIWLAFVLIGLIWMVVGT